MRVYTWASLKLAYNMKRSVIKTGHEQLTARFVLGLAHFFKIYACIISDVIDVAIITSFPLNYQLVIRRPIMIQYNCSYLYATM